MSDTPETIIKNIRYLDLVQGHRPITGSEKEEALSCEIADRNLCNKVTHSGFCCTRPSNHIGIHVATGPEEYDFGIYAIWTDEECV